jgi:signal transduction histidine kinase
MGSESGAQVVALRRQVFDLHAVFEVARQFHEVWDVDALLEGILHVAIEHLRVGAAAIVLADDERDLDQRPNQRSMGWESADETNWRVPADTLLALRLREYRHPLPIEVLSIKAPGNTAIISLWQKAGCVLLAPIVRRDSLQGVIFLGEKVDRTAFTSTDLELLDLLVDQFAVSLDNAQLYDRERLANEQLLATRQRLAGAEKLASLGQMAATIAHEVRNPLGIIRNHLELMRLGAEKRHDGVKDVQIIAEELDRIEHFVRELLGAFRPEQAHPGPVALATLLTDIANFLRPRFDKTGVAFHQDVDATTPKAHAEPNALRQVFTNICLNAIDAMDRGGRLRVTATTDENHVYLAFQDTGKGIAPELIERLFDPFVTTKPEGEGSGLGLAICRSLLERFGAQISGANAPAPEQGAIFTVQMRRADTQRQAGTIEVLPRR